LLLRAEKKKEARENKMSFQVDLKIKELAARGALFVVNHSGGKDSQAMFIKVSALVPKDQILVIHADLPGVEWEGTEAQARRYTGDLGFAYMVVRAEKTFYDMVRHRKMWPSPKYRQCTSDLKRGPIEKAIRHAVKDRDNKLVVNCMGLRAQESCTRKKTCESPLKLNEGNSKAGREWYDMLPIHDWSEEEVFQAIADEGQEPHWAYAAGMGRLSCRFCIMASKGDLQTAARLNPEAFSEIVAIEKEIDQTLVMPRKGQPRQFLEEYLGIQAL
jgi:3'-phosphoadenosine 5'-phosphosulfate sulfotransferase (PAPS reductase)/FAD synthetase